MTEELTRRNNKYLVLFVACLSFLLVFLATKVGIGLNVDSRIYIEGAENLLKHGEYSLKNTTGHYELITKWPIGTSVSLVPFLSLDGIKLEWVRFLYAVFMFLNVIAFSLVLGEYVKNRIVFFIFLFLFSIHPSILGVHFEVFSEPLFLFLTLLSIYFFSKALKDSSSSKLLLLSALLLGLSSLVRYAGFFTLLGFYLFLIIDFISYKRIGYRPSLKFFLVSITPSILWILRNAKFDAKVAGRPFIFYGDMSRQFNIVAHSILEWIYPFVEVSTFPYGLKVVILGFFLLLIFSVLTLQRKHPFSGMKAQSLLIVVLASTYILFYFLHLFFMDPTATLDKRTLLPLGIYLLIFFADSVNYFTFESLRASLRYLLFGFVIMVLGSNIVFSTIAVKHHFEDGVGLNSKKWQRSETLQVIRTLDKDANLFSNETSSIFLHTSRRANLLPVKRGFKDNKLNDHLSSDLLGMAERMKSSGYLIFFNEYEEIRDRWLSPSSEIVDYLNVELKYELSDGKIFVIKPHSE